MRKSRVGKFPTRLSWQRSHKSSMLAGDYLIIWRIRSATGGGHERLVLFFDLFQSLASGYGACTGCLHGVHRAGVTLSRLLSDWLLGRESRQASFDTCNRNGERGGQPGVGAAFGKATTCNGHPWEPPRRCHSVDKIKCSYC